MLEIIKKIVFILIILLVVDILWLLTIKERYKRMILTIQKKPLNPKLIYAGVVYIVIAYALYHFTKDCEKLSEKLMNAFVFGFCAYGIYDFTNAALISDWDIPLAVADTIWGGLLCMITVFIATKLNII